MPRREIQSSNFLGLVKGITRQFHASNDDHVLIQLFQFILRDIQLFSQLKNLNEIKAALQAVDSETARRMVAEVDLLLENVFASSKFG